MTPFPLRRLAPPAARSGALVAVLAATLLGAGTPHAGAALAAADGSAVAPPPGESAAAARDREASAPADPAPAARPSARALATIALLDVSRVPADILGVVQPGAEDGLTLLFLVARDPEHGDAPPMRELRDFEVDRKSYRQRTASELGVAIEPITIVEDVHDFLQRMSDEVPLGGKLPPAGEAFLVITTIGGAKLPEDGRVAFEVEIAVDGKKEMVPFTFPVPPAGDEETGLVPVVPDAPAGRAGREPMLSL